MTEDGRYRLLINAITDVAIFMVGSSGRVENWNQGAERISGYAADDIIGEPFSRLFNDDDREAGVPEAALETAKGEGCFNNQSWQIRKNGSPFWAHITINPFHDPAGKLIGYVILTRDLSEQKRAEEGSRHDQEQFRLLVQGVTDYSIYMLDPEGRVSNWNAGAQRIKGYLPEEIIGQHFSRFYTDADNASGEPARALKKAAEEGRYEKEGWRRRKDGSEFWAHVIVDRITKEDGSILGYAKITRDITERREAQQALEKAREALFQSQKIEAIGQLTGGVAHDFNNLLTAVIGSLEMLRRRLPDDPKAFQLIDNAIKGGQRGISLTQRMLAFARRQDLDLKPVDVPALVHGMADLMERSIGPQITIETRFPLNLKTVLADYNQLELALLNLAMNARDAMPEGGTIVIDARHGMPPGSAGTDPEYLCLAMTDTGEGMDEATLSRAVEPFFTTKGVGRGTGLGLSMVHGLLEQFGGQFILKSSKDVGTVAEMWLPVVSEPAMLESSRVVSAEDELSRPLKILAVDDDALVLMNTAAMLEELGHSVTEASSAEQALDILRSGAEVDLVITDQAMPQTTGTQLAADIRANWPSIPIIIATGYAELPAGYAQELPRLAKPFWEDDLRRAITNVISGTGPESGGERYKSFAHRSPPI